jgi:hypothetical protein
MSIYYATDSEAIYYIKDTGYLIHIVNSDEPEIYPKSGILEISKMYGVKIDDDQPPILQVALYLQKLVAWPMLATNYRELDTVNDEQIENHLIVLDNNEDIVKTLDIINEDSLNNIGNYTYQSEFHKLFYGTD